MMVNEVLVWTRVFSVLLAVGVGVAGSNFYDNGDSDAYTWSYPYPQSCSCHETDVSLSSCSYFRCNCACDVTAGKCDYGCCCDPDCSAAQVARFESLSSCAYEGVGDTEQYCYSSAQLTKINPRDGDDGFAMAGQSTAQNGVSGALCIEKKNFADRREFFEETGLQDASTVFRTTSGSKLHDYVELIVDLSPDSYYDQNDTIPVFTSSDGGSTFASADGLKFLRLPKPDFTGSCNDANFVEFEVEVATSDNSCIRQVNIPYEDSSTSGTITEVLTAQCEDMNSVERFVSSLYASTAPDVGFGTVAASSSNTLPVSIVSMSHVDFYTNEVTDVTSYWTATNSTCATTYYGSFSAYESGIQGGANENCTGVGSNSLTESTTRNSPICLGFITSVEYSVTHDQTNAGSISAIEATVTFTDLPLIQNMSTSVDNTNPITHSVFVAQSFGAVFSDPGAGTSGHNAVEGNIVNRTRSGNPGYLIGRPVLYGVPTITSANGSAISERVEGMYITGPLLNTQYSPSAYSLTTASSSAVGPQSGFSAKTTCPSFSDSLTAQTVNFGYDISTGCSLYLNRSKLVSLCESPSTSEFVNPSSLLPYFLEFNNGSLGIYGNADPLDENQWMSIIKTTPTTTDAYIGSVSWNDDTSTCTGFPNGLNIRILVAYSGERENPQNKIVSASYEYTTTPWKMRSDRSDTTSKQSFGMATTVSFIYKENRDLVGYKPPAPPLLFEVPHDVFYPFVQSSAEGSIRVGGPRSWILPVVMVISSLAVCWLGGIV